MDFTVEELDQLLDELYDLANNGFVDPAIPGAFTQLFDFYKNHIMESG